MNFERLPMERYVQQDHKDHNGGRGQQQYSFTMKFGNNNRLQQPLTIIKKCLDITTGAILELGSGLYSTPVLCEYAAEIIDYSILTISNKEWKKTGNIRTME